MDGMREEEMRLAVDGLEREHALDGKKIYLFGHCNATERLADLLMAKGYPPVAILDNNADKQGKYCNGLPIAEPREILMELPGRAVVCIAARAYEAMAQQLRSMGYLDPIYKMVEYDSYAEYSLSEETLRRKRERLERGLARHGRLSEKYPGYMKIFCPFNALGDVCFAMSYLPYFLAARGIAACVVCVIGDACAQVVKLFGDDPVEIFSQKEMDETIQAALYTEDKNSFIAHQDRPYVVNLHRALYVKKIPLEQIYCCGVFGLPKETEPCKPTCWRPYADLDRIPKGRSVILSPYAKSVTALPHHVWEQIVDDYRERGCQCFTNVAGAEKALPGTLPVSPKLAEVQSLVEHAGAFVGIRSGLCDVLRYAECDKTALYPDYNYCGTKWKAIDMYALEGWKNLVVKDDFVWKKS